MNVQKEKFFHILVFFTLAFGFSVVVFILNDGVKNPIIQPDESSYLLNAAAMSGYLNDFASSYSPGYSIIIAPAFFFGSGSDGVWFYVKIINAIIYFLLAVGIWCFVSLRTSRSSLFFERAFVTALVLVYPMWAVMVGYSFAQLAFSCVFVWAVFFLQRFFEVERVFIFCGFSFLVGFLYWIHPTGLAVIVAGGVVSLFYSFKEKSIVWIIIYLALSLISIVFYKYGFQPWLLNRMTIGGGAHLHYPSLKALLTPLWSQEGLYEVLGRFTGHVFYLVIGTLGLFWIGILVSLKESLKAVSVLFFRDSAHKFSVRPESVEVQCPLVGSGRTGFKKLKDRVNKKDGSLLGLVHVFLILCLTGIVFLSILLFSSSGADRLDHWMYGRYVEGVMAPILILGALFFNRKNIFQSVLVAVVLGILFYLMIGEYKHTARFNVSTFWQDFYVRDQSVIWWAIYSAALMFIVAVTGKTIGRGIIFCFFVFCIYLHTSWHKDASVEASKRWGLATAVRNYVDSGACIAFDHSGIDGYSKHVLWFDFGFQLYDYRLQRMDPKRWFESGCDGPLLSFRDDIAEAFDIDVYVIGVSKKEGLLIWEKRVLGKGVYLKRAAGQSNFDLKEKGSYIFDPTGKSPCLMGSCLVLNADALRKFSKVGQLSSGYLQASGVAGYLFFGPYAAVDKGKYQVAVAVKETYSGVALLDVVSGGGKVSHAALKVTDPLPDHDVIRMDFELKEAVNDLEIRLRVDESSMISVESVSLIPTFDTIH